MTRLWLRRTWKMTPENPTASGRRRLDTTTAKNLDARPFRDTYKNPTTITTRTSWTWKLAILQFRDARLTLAILLSALGSLDRVRRPASLIGAPQSLASTSAGPPGADPPEGTQCYLHGILSHLIGTRSCGFANRPSCSRILCPSAWNSIGSQSFLRLLRRFSPRRIFSRVSTFILREIRILVPAFQ